MRKPSIFKTIDKEPITLADNQVFAVKGRSIQIGCLQGHLWVTWPDGHERVLKDGQSMSLDAKGKICVQALSPSRVQVCKTGQGAPCLRLSYGQCSV